MSRQTEMIITTDGQGLADLEPALVKVEPGQAMDAERAERIAESILDIEIASLRRGQLVEVGQSLRLTMHIVHYLAVHSVPQPLRAFFFCLPLPPRRWPTLLESTDKIGQPQLSRKLSLFTSFNTATKLPKRCGLLWLLSWVVNARVKLNDGGWITLATAAQSFRMLPMARIMDEVTTAWLSQLALNAVGTLLTLELQVPAYREKFQAEAAGHENAIWAEWMELLPPRNPAGNNPVSPTLYRAFAFMERSLQVRILLEIRAKAFLSAIEHVATKFSSLPMRIQTSPLLQANVEASIVGAVQFRTLLETHREAIKSLERATDLSNPSDEQLKSFDDLASTIDQETFELAAMVTQLAAKLEHEFVHANRDPWQLIRVLFGLSQAPLLRRPSINDIIKERIKNFFSSPNTLQVAKPVPDLGDNPAALRKYLKKEQLFANMWVQNHRPQWPAATKARCNIP